MPYPNDRLKQLSPKPGHQSGAQRSRRSPFLVTSLALVLAALACGGSADGVVMLERLPTLTPTLNPIQVAMALAAAPEGAAYCVAGRVRNPGESLGAYLMIAAVLYDGQDQGINYHTSRQDSFGDLAGDQIIDVRVCVDALNQEVVRNELRA